MNLDIQLIEFGRYEIPADHLKKVVHYHSPKEYFYEATANTPLLEKTTKIPLFELSAFGIKFIVEECEIEEIPPLRMCILHPEIENSETNFSFHQTVRQIQPELAKVHFEFVIFEKQWEMIPGYWTFQILDDYQLLLSKEFEVYAQAKEMINEEKYFYDM